MVTTSVINQFYKMIYSIILSICMSIHFENITMSFSLCIYSLKKAFVFQKSWKAFTVVPWLKKSQTYISHAKESLKHQFIEIIGFLIFGKCWNMAQRLWNPKKFIYINNAQYLLLDNINWDYTFIETTN